VVVLDSTRKKKEMQSLWTVEVVNLPVAGGVHMGAGITLFVPKDRLVFVLNLPNVVGGMLLPLVLVLMILLCNDRRLMGRYVNGRIFNGIVWTTTVLMTVLTLLIIVTTLFPGLFGGP